MTKTVAKVKLIYYCGIGRPEEIVSGVARFGITNGRPMQRLELEVEIDGAWSAVDATDLRDLPVQGYSVEIDAPVGTTYRVRHTEFYAGEESPFSGWSVPGVLVPEPGAGISFVVLALLLAAMSRRRA